MFLNTAHLSAEGLGQELMGKGGSFRSRPAEHADN